MEPSEALEIVMTEQNLSDVQVAAAVTVSQGTVGRWLAKKSDPRWSHVRKLAEEFPRFGELIGLTVA